MDTEYYINEIFETTKLLFYKTKPKNKIKESTIDELTILIFDLLSLLELYRDKINDNYY